MFAEWDESRFLDHHISKAEAKKHLQIKRHEA